MRIQRFAAGSAASPTTINGAMMRAAQLNGGELSVASLRALSPFEENAQKFIDQAVVRVGLQRLVFAADIMAAGLTFPLTNPLSIMEVQWEQISKVGGAQRTMSPSARGENGLPDRRQKRIPIFCTTDDFSIGIRSFQMSQRIGTPIDVTLVEEATRRVNEAIEDAALNGAIQVDGYTTPGLLNAPNANTQALSVDWTAAPVLGTTGPAMLADVLNMVGKAQADFKFGPFNLYVGTIAGNNLENDFKANGELTIRQRLEQISAGGRNIQVRVADQFPGASTGTQCALVQMTSDVVDMIDGQRPTVIPWTSVDGLTLYWMVLAIMVSRVRDDYDGNSGIVLGQKA